MLHKRTHVLIFLLALLFALQTIYSQQGPALGAIPVRGEYLQNIALRMPVDVSSIYTMDFNAANAVDNDETTIWASLTTDKTAWLYVDLQEQNLITGVGLKWFDKYYAGEYYIAGSNNGTDWKMILHKKDGAGGVEYLHIRGTYRYVGIYCVKKNSAAYALKEFEVYRMRLQFAVEASVLNETTGIPERVDARLVVGKNDRNIIQQDLTDGLNIITLTTYKANYQVIIEKNGYYSSIQLITPDQLSTMLDTPLQVTLQPRAADTVNVDSLHVSYNLYLPGNNNIDIKCSNDLAFIRKPEGIMIIDITDVYHPAFISFIKKRVIAYSVNDTYLFVLGENDIALYDITDPDNIVIATTIDLGETITGNGYFVATNTHIMRSNSAGTAVYAISDITNITETQTKYYFDTCDEEYAYTTTYYVTPFDEGYVNFDIYSLKDPENITHIYRTKLDIVNGYPDSSSFDYTITRSGNYLFLECFRVSGDPFMNRPTKRLDMTVLYGENLQNPLNSWKYLVADNYSTIPGYIPDHISHAPYGNDYFLIYDNVNTEVIQLDLYELATGTKKKTLTLYSDDIRVYKNAAFVIDNGYVRLLTD